MIDAICTYDTSLRLLIINHNNPKVTRLSKMAKMGVKPVKTNMSVGDNKGHVVTLRTMKQKPVNKKVNNSLPCSHLIIILCRAHNPPEPNSFVHLFVKSLDSLHMNGIDLDT